MFKNFRTLIALVIFTGSFVAASAQTKPLNITTTAVPFLRIAPDARSGGMGDAGIATSPDANSSLWNIAKIPFARSKSAIGVTYIPWLRALSLKDVYYTSLAGYYQLDETQAISSSFKYFSLGNIQFIDDNGNNLNSFRPREYSFDAGYSRKLSNKLALGIALRYIHSSLAKGNYNGQTYKPASAVAGDINLFHDGTNGMTSSGLNWGVTVSNLGSKISYTNNDSRKDFLPANLGVGLAYTKVFNEATKATFTVDVNQLLVASPPELSGNNTSADSAAIENYRNKGVLSSAGSSFNNGPGQISAGAEVMFQEQFVLRGGYFYETKRNGGRRYYTVGGGLNYESLGLNFSFLIPSNKNGNGTISPLENTFRTSILFNLGRK